MGRATDYSAGTEMAAKKMEIPEGREGLIQE